MKPLSLFAVTWVLAASWGLTMLYVWRWPIFAFVISRPSVFNWLRHRAMATPYTHLGTVADRYMERYWVFNPYGKDADDKVTPPRWPWLPSIRLHHICRPDADDHLHDHPWGVARTVVCEGWYREEKPFVYPPYSVGASYTAAQAASVPLRSMYLRDQGYTGELLLGEFHRISEVSIGGVWTFFITWGPSHGWGFAVNGEKVPYRQYLADKPERQ